jgi:hypothetical protein
MGIFEYQCPHGHVTELFVPLKDRPDTVDCNDHTCGYKAQLVLSATPTTFRANDRKAFKRQGH